MEMLPVEQNDSINGGVCVTRVNTLFHWAEAAGREMKAGRSGYR
jgi:hypothetical protein